MDWLIQIFQIANTLSPIGIIGMLVGLLYLVQVQYKKVHAIETNHLHDLTDILQRMERNMEVNFAKILERLDR